MFYKSIEFKADDIQSNERKFTGYASTWDLDQGSDIIQKGAFKKTLGERKNGVKVLWQHDPHQPIGKPLSMAEDSKGLLVEAQLSNTTLGNDAIQLMKDGVVDKMSIGFSIPSGKSVIEKGIRTIKEIKLFEFSLVTFPMNESAVLTGVKSIKNELNAEHLSFAEIKELQEYLNSLLLKQKPSSDTIVTERQPSEKELMALKTTLKNFKL